MDAVTLGSRQCPWAMTAGSFHYVPHVCKECVVYTVCGVFIMCGIHEVWDNWRNNRRWRHLKQIRPI